MKIELTAEQAKEILDFDDKEEPIMVLARKRLEDVKDGTYRPTNSTRER